MKNLVSESLSEHLISGKSKSFLSESEIAYYNQIKKEILGIRSINKNKLVETQLESYLVEGKIIDAVKKYLKKGILTVGIVSTLLSNNVVSAQELKQAGVPDNMIKVEMTQGTKESKVQLSKIESVLLKSMKENNEARLMQQYNKLSGSEKNNVLTHIANTFGKDYKSIENIKLNLYTAAMDTVGLLKIADYKSEAVSMKEVKLEFNLSSKFDFNSSKLTDPTSTKDTIQNILNSFYHVDSIEISGSCSTLRNTGEAEGKTWKELNKLRGLSIFKIVDGMEYSISDSLPSLDILPGIIKVNTAGENGDGTSGPKSTFEINPINYKNIDPALWSSKGKGTPYANKEEYKQHQWVKVIVRGHVVSEDVKDMRGMKWMKLSIRPLKGSPPPTIGGKEYKGGCAYVNEQGEIKKASKKYGYENSKKAKEIKARLKGYNPEYNHGITPIETGK